MLLVTWNVNGLRARFAEVSELVENLHPDVVCLQEIKATAEQVPEPLTGLPSYYSHYHGDFGGYSGVSVHVHRDHGRPAYKVPGFDFETRIVVADLGIGLRVASVYVPNGNKDLGAKLRFLGDLASWGAGQTDLIIAGDLNVALTDNDVHPRMRSDDAVGQLTAERDTLAGLIAAGYADVVREAHPERDDVFTWWPPWREEKAKNRGWRIDFALLPARLGAAVTKVEILSDFGGSDHAPVLVEFGL